LGHYQGYYVPISPYRHGFNGGIRVGQSLYPYYPNAFGLGYNSFGYNSFGAFNNVGGFNNGFGVNPVYSTYGTFLNSGGVLNSNVIGSSVAAQEMQRLQNPQQAVPFQSSNNIRDIEILRLQLELERARQRLAQEQPAQQQQRTMKIPTPDNQKAIDQLGLAPVLESNQLASASQLKAERAFRSGDYGQAARFAGLASSLDDSNGKLLLFKSQAHFANGEYREAVEALSNASSVMETKDIGWVVENFKLFYGQNDYVSQMQSLTSQVKNNANDSDAYLLRGYQYGALGYGEAAKKDLERAKELGADGTMVDKLLNRFGEVVLKSGE
jgi:tetratricopeptide (TPR) repeat protein